MRSQVQVLVVPPEWGISSAGRAPALHAGGQRFDPAILHHNGFSLGLLKFVVVNIKRSCLKATERFMCDSGIAYGSYVRIKAFKLICGNNSG